MTPSILPKLWQNGLRTTKSRYWSGYQSPDLNHIEHLGQKNEKVCASREAYKPESVTPALSGGMGQNSSNLLWELVEGYPKHLAGRAGRDAVKVKKTTSRHIGEIYKDMRLHMLLQRCHTLICLT
jgi:hypothetical protein